MTRVQAMLIAREMYADGDAWTVTEIQRRLNERGVPCAWATVKRWVDDTYAERHRVRDRQQKRRSRREQRGVRTVHVRVSPTADGLFARMVDLRDAGLSYTAVAAVVLLDTGINLSAEDVRYAINAGRPSREWRKKGVRP